MNKIALVKRFLLLVSVIFFASCDKDFNTIGSDIVGEDYFDFTKTEQEVTAYNFPTGPVQTNNLPLNSLGVYNNPVTDLGSTTSHFVTQAELPVSNVIVNSNPVVDSVWVYVPFFSTQTGTDADGIRQYELDSISGDENGADLEDQKFKLKVYENGYYLGNYNPNNTNGTQRHYSDDKDKVEVNKRGATAIDNPASMVNGLPLNNGSLAENDEFFFNDEERIIYKTNGEGEYVDASGVVLTDQGDIGDRVVQERFAPGIWLNLNKAYFAERILKAPADQLANNNTFKNYFRGLYFQVEAIAGQGAMASLDFSKGYIRITYNTDNVLSSPTATEIRLKRTLQLKLGGNCINFFDTSYSLPSNPNRIHLKGGNGSMAYVDLFGADDVSDLDNVPEDLEVLRASGWMINEANLTFYIDKTSMRSDGNPNTEELAPNRIYLYDYKNKKPILDYLADGSTNSANPKYNKRGFGGIIEKDANGDMVKYKIRITEYLKNVIKHKDSTNYRLGIAVSESINLTTNAYLKPASGQQPSAMIPLSSVINPLGTILYSPTSEDPTKRLKLEIYYTKPD
ncbi:hypothetical protein FLJC2902T_11050 [Flavobacterium limnosediminis JC2902]|uniref:DUF4270 domain-containing protein n=1 Tax=Flavobacterium limnosediminis JC2902 TaxID=1341181 RepID=V6SQU8_9FLAO|nr:DUF4270 domain-containing protein [Flavobacterium limnosediminis]ESU29068.1 hypothetical protein FLJC2902T_11050 [Flavobacterium limnosediminis JC2902]